MSHPSQRIALVNVDLGHFRYAYADGLCNRRSNSANYGDRITVTVHLSWITVTVHLS
jgi:hypothetical protein